ncbi:ferredoxin [Rhodococcus sp. ACPA4]|uniref:2Fe-2S iron-sulfur cluster-binding protein n=1 Tax=unclassified Rhodococcus (in: high G+C Gram-positive bacteria) TaxID=192944 RepID=UPI0005D33619|nr:MULTISPECIES: 2Fe-2S iron-sulfur cluster-binding protein [unclassified Rhodococcus (in: high G+C Gram-positive bacteria)]KJF19239.1 Rhodocoxin [Rhodococcus sp. AD45]PBC35867.1 ferredoxin [Rhodococcus sp. ACPA4]ROZ42790.1 ferredoxin [Rhodococcus sp. WS3]RZL20958.1 MAG: 2Fe-2S iron-sulfur cluster binding domain-containing protein [Rhodococcus sp. (in: high G+C Gram-positive bacteria)]
MPKISFRLVGGTETIVDAIYGTSVMQAALGAGIDEIVAECGGNAMCATCHVYVESTDIALPDIGEVEDEMLDNALAPRLETSRLSCQLPVTADIDGLVVVLPSTQY